LKPYGLKPYGLKPYGLKPYGLKPYGLKPYGLKPYGLKPYGLKGDLDESAGEQWSAEITELVTERSAVLRLGATVVSAEENRNVPFLGVFTAGTLPLGSLVVGSQTDSVRVRVNVPNRSARELADHPELAEPVKADLARYLASELDSRVVANVPLTPSPPPDQLQLLRGLVQAVQGPLIAPGWLMQLAYFNNLTQVPTADTRIVAAGNRTLDSYAALRRDGADGGALFGFPVVTSTATAVVFSSDWNELWIGIERNLVTVDFSQGSNFTADRTVIRATMNFGTLLRSPGAFARAL
jgi:hypothetical protein